MVNALKDGVSISIVTYNTWKRTAECIRSAVASIEGRPYEVLVFDNGKESSADTDWPSQVHIIQSEQNLGFGAGHNANLARATYKTFIILNPDVNLNSQTVEALTAVLQEPNVAAAAPILVYPDGSEQLSFRRLPTVWTELGRIFGADRRPDTRWSTLRRIAYGQGRISVEQPAAAVLAVATSTLKEINGFDTAYPMYFEDVDLCARLLSRGEIIAMSDFTAVHDGEGTAKRFRQATTFWIENSRRRYHKKFERGARLRVILAATWASGFTHAIATAAKATVATGNDRQDLFAKSQGYFASLVASLVGPDKYWRDKFLKK